MALPAQLLKERNALKISSALIAAVLSLSVFAEDGQALTKLAVSGDVHAQRKLAYALANGQFGFQKQPVEGCAWYRVVLLTQDKELADRDPDAEWVNCSKLPLADNRKAWGFAKAISRKIGFK